MKPSTLVVFACFFSALQAGAMAQAPSWNPVPGSTGPDDWYAIPGTNQVRCREDDGDLKWRIVGSVVEFKADSIGTGCVIEDTDSGKSVSFSSNGKDDLVVDVYADGSSVTLTGPSENCDVDINGDSNSCNVEGDNNSTDLFGASDNNSGNYTSTASGNTHADQGSGSGNTYTDAGGNSGPW